MPKLFLRIRDHEVDYLVRGLTPADAIDESNQPSEPAQNSVSGSCALDELADVVAEWVGSDPWTLDPTAVVVFIPTAQTLSITCEVPGRNVAQRRRALPFAVEEFVTANVESLHIATGEIERDRAIRTLCVPKTTIDEWLDVLRNAQVEPGLMTADAYALPAPVDEAIVWFEDDLATIRSPAQIATIDSANLNLVLASLREEFDVDEDKPVLVQINGSASTKALRDAGFLTNEVRSEVVGPALEYFAAQADERKLDGPPYAPINLLQGDYRPIKRLSSTSEGFRSVLRWVASVALLVVVLTAVEGVWASRRADLERVRANDLYEELFEARPSGNPAARMRRALGRMPDEDGADFLPLLDALAHSLEASVTTFSLRNLSFAKGQRGLVADLAVPDYASLDALEEAVTERGLAWTLSSAQQEDNRIRARIMVEAL